MHWNCVFMTKNDKNVNKLKIHIWNSCLVDYVYNFMIVSWDVFEVRQIREKKFRNHDVFTGR
jgi:hypothetical protein